MTSTVHRRVLIASGFFESELVSFREYSYSKGLAKAGYDVTLLCGDQSYIWQRSRVCLPPTEPARRDTEFVRESGVNVLRRRVFFRVSDFVLYWPSLHEIRRADIVHVIEFRQGITVVIAVLARLLGKPVVYDHEQRGDRSARWYSSVDSVFRRLLILIGSFTVDCVRHTVFANRDHYLSCTPRRTRMILAPLGADPEGFHYDALERARARQELGLRADDRVAIFSGKLHRFKHVIDVVRACRQAGVKLLLVGTLADDTRRDLDALGPGDEIVLPQASAERLRALYNAADYAVFTTFSVSYWEAHATGVHLIVPGTAFSRAVLATDGNVSQFGEPSMFRIPDEEYKAGVDLTPQLVETLSRARPAEPRRSRTEFSSDATARELSALYEELLDARKRRTRGGGGARGVRALLSWMRKSAPEP